MITCPKCSKDNQDHYKFCLGCGAELPRDVGPKPFVPQTPIPTRLPTQPPMVPVVPPPPPVPNVVPAPVNVAPPEPNEVAARTPFAPEISSVCQCPQCGHTNATSNLFCSGCGFRLEQAAPRSVRQPAVAAPSTPGSIVLTALRADGTEAATYALPTATMTVGRETGAIFAGDSYLSPRHATFTQTASRVTIRDEGSLNGVYKKLVRDAPVELKPNDVFRIGQEIIKYEALTPQAPSPDGVERLGSPATGYVGRIALVIGRDVTGNAFPVPETGVHLGRERGDVLFPEDGYVSGLHCRLSWEDGRLMLTDLGSSNGSFLRLREETEIRSGDILLMGQQLFRVAI